VIDDVMRAALQRIMDWSDCRCEHDTDDCCANCADADFHCPGCIAARALLTRDRSEDVKDAHAYLSRLLTHHAPQCEPLPDLLGVCTQIDNLLTGYLTRDRSVSAPQEPPPLWRHAIQECNEAHAALDRLGAPKTKRVLNRSNNGSSDITLGLRDRILSLPPIEEPSQWSIENRKHECVSGSSGRFCRDCGHPIEEPSR
jgi:hypothetical protein